MQVVPGVLLLTLGWCAAQVRDAAIRRDKVKLRALAGKDMPPNAAAQVVVLRALLTPLTAVMPPTRDVVATVVIGRAVATGRDTGALRTTAAERGT